MNATEPARESDPLYFELAAERMMLPGGELVWMSGLTRLHSASTVQRVTQDASPEMLLDSLEKSGAELNLPALRLYLFFHDRYWESRLTDRGYGRRDESIFAADRAVRSRWPRENTLSLFPIRDDAGWALRLKLFDRFGRAPDGHCVNAADYLEMERRKTAAGGIEFYLVRDADGRVIASYGMMKVAHVARLKNLIVHPEWRGQGIGTRLMYCIGKGLSDEVVLVAYAVKLADHLSLYERCGFSHMADCHEWSK